MHDVMTAALRQYLLQRFPQRRDPAVLDLTSLTAGWESDVFSFDLVHGPPEDRTREPLILRLYPGPAALARAKAAHEFRALRLLARAGYPVPRVDALEADASPFGPPFLLMERVRGEVLGRLAQGAEPGRRRAYLRLTMTLLARLHRLDPRPFAESPAALGAADGRAPLRAMLDRWQAQIAALSGSAALGRDGALEGLWGWFRAGAETVPPGRPAVIHLDFHQNNILLREDGSPVVIDWTGLDVADPRVDLAWTLVLSYGGGPALQAAMLAEYERASGAAVEGLAYFSALAAARRVWSVCAALTLGAGALGMRPGAEEAIRRSLPAVAAHYRTVVATTGQRLPAVEELLAGGA